MKVVPVTSPEDIQETAALAATIWREYWPHIIGSEQTEYMINTFQSEEAITQQLRDGYHYYLAGEKSRWRGYCAILPEGDRMMLSKLYVRADSRGQGYGRAMIDTILNECAKASCSTVWLVVNRNNRLAIAVYEAMGFVKTGTRVKEIGHGYVVDDYIYELAV